MGLSQESTRHAGQLSGCRLPFIIRTDRGFPWLRIGLVALLLFAAAQKAYDTLSPGSAKGLGYATLAVVLGESAVAVLLLLCCAPVAWRLGVFTFAAFAVVAAYKWRGGSASCGCLGRLEVPPAISLAIDLAALAALGLLRPASCAGAVVRPRVWVGAAVAWMALCAFLYVAFAKRLAVAEGVTVTASGHVLLEPAKWIGKELPILRDIQPSPAALATGGWTLMLLRPGCAHCEDALARWNQNHGTGRGLIVQTSPGDGPAGAARLADDRTWIVAAPLFLELQEGRVTAVSAEPPQGRPRLDEDVSRGKES